MTHWTSSPSHEGPPTRQGISQQNVCLEADNGPRPILHPLAQSGSPSGCSMVAPAMSESVRVISQPILTAGAAIASFVHGRLRIMVVWSLGSPQLAADPMAE